MSTIFLQHRVADYDAWRPVYDADRPRRDAAGLREIGVYRDADDPNMVLIVWDADGPEGFRAMFTSEELKAKMQEAGVVSAPEYWIGDKG
jgi:hypothetical protein